MKAGLIVAAVAAAVVLVACNGEAGTLATPTEPGATSTRPPSTITVRFVRDGEPVVLNIGDYQLRANGELCNVQVVEWTDVTEFRTNWPPISPPPPECGTAGSTLEFAFVIFEALIRRQVTAAFVWNGADMSVDLDLDAPQSGPSSRPQALLSRAPAYFASAAESSALNSVGDPPVITSVEPDPAREWSLIAIEGENLTTEDGSCDISIGGITAYVQTCGSQYVAAIVPWGAQPGNLKVKKGTLDANWPIAIQPADIKSEEIVPGVIQVKVKPGFDILEIAKEQSDTAEQVTSLGKPDEEVMKLWFSLVVAPGQEVAKSKEYSLDSRVLYAGPSPVEIPDATPDDPEYKNGNQWALNKIAASIAWDYSKGNGAIIAIDDTGFKSTHEDLQTKLLAGWNCAGGRNIDPVGELANHGTWVAGVAAAATNNNTTGIAGLGWDSSILPLRYRMDNGNSCGEAGNIFLLDRAIEAGADVYNMSYTFGGPTAGLCDKLEQAWQMGIVPVGIAGNDGAANVKYPAACNFVLAVAATTNTASDSRRFDSNYGNWVHLAAPGDNIRTTDGDADNDYNWIGGTSLAAPHVSGLAALLASQGYSAIAIRDIILRNTKSLEWWDQGTPILRGRIDASLAVKDFDTAGQSRGLSGDFNGDGKDDFLVAYDYGNDCTAFWVWTSTGSGFNAPTQWRPTWCT